MKIAYFAHWSEGEGSGVFHKVIGQVREWVAAGHDVTLGVCSAADTRTSWCESLPPAVRFRHQLYSSSWGRVTAPGDLVAWFADGAPDLVYFRNNPWTPALERIMDRFPTVIEVNSDDVAERRTRGPLIRAVHSWGRRRLFRLAAGAVFVDDRLPRAPAFRAISCPSEVIGNGADFTDLAVVPPTHHSGYRLLSIVSSRQEWHGLDLLPDVLDDRPAWSVDIVGLSAPMEGTRTHPRMRYHGRMLRSEFAALAAMADAGIGTLALFRKGMSSATSLKHRECLAMGMPLILGCDDPDIARGARYACFVDNSKFGLRAALPEVDRFLALWKGSRVPRADIDHLSIQAKEARRLEFFESVLSGVRR